MRQLPRLALLLLAGIGSLVAGASWLSARRRHGTPDHWPPVAHKPAAR